MPSTRPVINDRWKLRNDVLGQGSGGRVWKGTDSKTREIVAIKMEPRLVTCPRLQHESDVYDILHKSSKQVAGFPKQHFFGELGNQNVLVMQCLGRSLEELRHLRRGLSLKFVLNAGVQALKRIKYMHHKSLIHRDIKPENLVTGRKDSQRVYLIDFGFATKYRDSVSNAHILYSEGNQVVGTPAFMSLNAHRGAAQSRRDDLISLGYTLVHLFKGSLPWNAVDAKYVGPPDRNAIRAMQERVANEICSYKQRTPLSELCEGMPSEMLKYFTHVQNLKFTDKPDYALLQSLLIQASKTKDRRGKGNSKERKGRFFMADSCCVAPWFVDRNDEKCVA